MRRRRGRLYSQTPLPFWPAMAGRIAIGSRAAAEPLVRFFGPARTNGHAVSLPDYKKASVEEEKKNVSHTSVFDPVLVPYLREPRLQ